MNDRVRRPTSTPRPSVAHKRQASLGQAARATIAALFLGGLAVITAGPGRAKEVDAKQVYEARCSLCHGVEGAGNGPAGSSLQPPPTDFTSADYWREASAEKIKRSIAQGKPGTAMIPFAAVLKPEEIDALVDYLRGFAAGKERTATKGARD